MKSKNKYYKIYKYGFSKIKVYKLRESVRILKILILKIIIKDWY